MDYIAQLGADARRRLRRSAQPVADVGHTAVVTGELAWPG